MSRVADLASRPVASVRPVNSEELFFSPLKLMLPSAPAVTQNSRTQAMIIATKDGFLRLRNETAGRTVRSRCDIPNIQQLPQRLDSAGRRTAQNKTERYKEGSMVNLKVKNS
jgi:hypothetical protein